MCRGMDQFISNLASGNHHEAIQGLGGSQGSMQHFRHPGTERGFSQQHRQRNFDEGSRLEGQISLIIENQEKGVTPQINGGTDILPAVDAVSGRPDDFRHVSPDGIEALTREGSAVTGTGDRDFTGFCLVPGA